ncbi:MAG: hypothetical protein ACRENS_02540 [Candidatus Eiseniibacteriota bacterium]
MMIESRSLLKFKALLVLLVVFLASIQALAIAASLAGIPIARGSALGILAASMVLAWFAGLPDGLRAERLPAAASAAGEGPAAPAADSPRAPGSAAQSATFFAPRTRRALLIAALTLLGSFLVLACLSRDTSFDGNAYHIPPINQWAVAGRIHEIDAGLANSELMNGFPKGAEVVAFVFVRAFGDNVLNLLNVFHAPLGLLGIALLCLLFGAGSEDALLFGVCYLLTPASVLQFGTTYVDAAFACSVIALLALLTASLAMPRGHWFADALPIGCAMGMVIATKASGVLIVVIALGVFKLFGFLRRRAGSGQDGRGALAALLSVAALVGAAVGGFWYVRNCVLHGNPLYPIRVAFAGRVIWPGMPQGQVLFEAPNTPPALLALHPAARVLVSWLSALNPSLRALADYGPDRRLGSLGPLWILGCVPAIVAGAILLARRDARGARDAPSRSALSFLLATVALSFLAMPMNWWGRYTVWVFALGLPAIWYVPGAARMSDRWRNLAQRWVVACIVLMLAQDALMVAKETKWTLAAMANESREPHAFPLYPEMNSALLKQIVATPGAIGVGPRELGRDVTIYGQIAQAEGVGEHELVPVAADLSETQARALSEHVRYVLWLTSTPMPPALAAHATARGAEGPFTYLELAP